MAATSSPPTLQAASPASGLASASNNSFFSALFAANNPPEEGRPTSGHSSHGTNYSGDQGVQELKANILADCALSALAASGRTALKLHNNNNNNNGNKGRLTPSSNPSVLGAASSSGGNRRRACDYCGKICSSSSALLYHTRLHTGERPYQCDMCPKSFIQKVHLQRHLESNHGKIVPLSEVKAAINTSTRRPAIGKKVSQTPPSSTHHAQSQQPLLAALSNGASPAKKGNKLEALTKKLMQSRGAPTTAGDDESVSPPTLHQVAATGDAVGIKCNHCGERFGTDAALFMHIVLAHGARQEGVPAGDAASINGILGHMTTLLGAAMVQGATTTRADAPALPATPPRAVVNGGQQTVAAHKEGKGVTSMNGRADAMTCSQCGVRVIGQLALLEHVFEAHGTGAGDSADDDVDDVDEEEDDEDALQIDEEAAEQHDRAQPAPVAAQRTASRLAKCDECGKEFSSWLLLERHAKTFHPGARALQCDQCERAFVNYAALQAHQKSHLDTTPTTHATTNAAQSAAKPFACRMCGKTFSTTRTLKIHSMIHTGERPYKCKFCHRQFIQQIHLVRHLRSHIRRAADQGTTTNVDGATDNSDVLNALLGTIKAEPTSATSTSCSNCANTALELRQLRQEVHELRDMVTTSLASVNRHMQHMQQVLESVVERQPTTPADTADQARETPDETDGDNCHTTDAPMESCDDAQ